MSWKNSQIPISPGTYKSACFSQPVNMHNRNSLLLNLVSYNIPLNNKVLRKKAILGCNRLFPVFSNAYLNGDGHHFQISKNPNFCMITTHVSKPVNVSVHLLES